MNLSRQYKLYKLGIDIPPPTGNVIRYMEEKFDKMEVETHVFGIKIHRHYHINKSSYIYRFERTSGGLMSHSFWVDTYFLAQILKLRGHDWSEIETKRFALSMSCGEIIAFFINIKFGEKLDVQKIDIFFSNDKEIKELFEHNIFV